MALITETLLALVRKHIETHGTLVWYDPEKAYLDLAYALAPEQVSGAAVYRYEPERGFVWLRNQLEPLWAVGTAPPKLLLYVPLRQVQSQNALLEYEVAGAVLQPGQQPPDQNTALAVVARDALVRVFPPAALQRIIAQVEEGKLSRAELDELAERGVKLPGVLALIFGNLNSREVALRFLTEPALDRLVEERQASDELATLLAEAFGVPFSAAGGITELRAKLARQVLVTELTDDLGDQVPQELRTFPLAESAVARQEATQLAREWRNRRDLAGSYCAAALRVQADIGLAALKMGPEALARTEGFAAIEVCLQEGVEEGLAKAPSPGLVELAESRINGFWSAQDPTIKTRWGVVASAGRVLIEAARVERALKGKVGSAVALFSHYVSGSEPWCALDEAQRHLERDFSLFDPQPQTHESLLQLVARARQRYGAATNELAERFSRAYLSDQFELPGVLQQVDIYRDLVAPAVKDGRTAYLLVDAFRFEMARELCSHLDEGWKSELTPAVAMVPTITEIGMAALLPGAEKGLLVLSADGNRLAVVVAGKTVKMREERVAYFGQSAAEEVLTIRLDQLVPLANPHLRRKIEAAPMILVTAAEEIDGLCESTPTLARRMLDDVFNQLRRGIKQLFALGVQTIVISADHGYLFGERLASGDGIDPPGGKTAVLKRRVWVGQGGASSASCLRQPLSAFGMGGELEMATPWNLSCFRVPGGASQYFHGGLSLQELVIPVVTVRRGPHKTLPMASQIQWELDLGGGRISTRFLSVAIDGRSMELLPVQPQAVRVEVRAADRAISVPVSATYGFQEITRDVLLQAQAVDSQALQSNTVTLMITEMPPANEVTIHLLDASTGVSLARLERVPFGITF